MIICKTFQGIPLFGKVKVLKTAQIFCYTIFDIGFLFFYKFDVSWHDWKSSFGSTKKRKVGRIFLLCGICPSWNFYL